MQWDATLAALESFSTFLKMPKKLPATFADANRENVRSFLLDLFHFNCSFSCACSVDACTVIDLKLGSRMKKR